MNRKHRRATQDKSGSADALSAAGELFQRAIAHQGRGELDDAARLYKRVLGYQPGHAGTHNNLAQLRLAQGRRNDAS
ncbi:MAG: tetratricopeptide repeat protein, partial [Pseudolabrys sp.]